MKSSDSQASISPLQRALDELEASIIDGKAAHRVLADALENGIASPGTPPTRSEAHGHRASAHTLGERFDAVREAVRAVLPAPPVAARAADLLAMDKRADWDEAVRELLRAIVAGRMRPSEHTVTFVPSGVPGVLSGEGPVTPPALSHARTLTEQQLAKALSCSVDEWCKSVTDGTLFDLWCSYVGVTPNTYESALAYGAFRAARDYFSTKAHQRYQPAELVYTAPAPKAEASPNLQTAIGEMDSSLNALVNEVAPDVVQNLRTRFEDVLRHTNNQLLKPSHELEALRTFHENVTRSVRLISHIMRSDTTAEQAFHQLAKEVTENNGQALMKPRQLDAIGVTVSGTNPAVPNVPSTATFVETPGLFGTGTVSSPTFGGYVVASTPPEITGIAGQGGRIKRVDVDTRTEQRRQADDRIREEAEATVPVAKREDGAYTAGPPPDGRPVAEHLDELAAGKATRVDDPKIAIYINWKDGNVSYTYRVVVIGRSTKTEWDGGKDALGARHWKRIDGMDSEIIAIALRALGDGKCERSYDNGVLDLRVVGTFEPEV